MKARRFFIIFPILFFGLSLTLSAGSYFGMSGVGLKVGVNQARIVNHPNDPQKQTGYCLGIIYNRQLNRNFSLRAELLVNGKGFKIQKDPLYDIAGALVDSIPTVTSVSYLELPLAARFTFPLPGKYRPYLLAGGFGAIKIRERVTVPSFGLEYDIATENAESLDAGLILGAGIDIKAGQGKMFFELRYDLSLTPIIKDKDYKSRVLSFQTGYWW